MVGNIMKRVQVGRLDVLEWLFSNADSCLEKGGDWGALTSDDAILAREDFIARRVAYWADTSGEYGYVRTFLDRDEIVVDFGRPLEQVVDNIGALAQLLNRQLIVSRVVPSRQEQIPHLSRLPFQPDSRFFSFGPEHPKYRVCFPNDGEYKVLTLDPNDF